LTEYIDHETTHARRVPDYDLSILLTAIGIYLLKKTTDVLVEEVRDRARRFRKEEKARVQDKLEEERHAETMKQLDRLANALQEAILPRSPESIVNEDVASASVLLEWAKNENVRIDIVLETEAEGDLKETLEALTKELPGRSVSDARRQLEGDSPTQETP